LNQQQVQYENLNQHQRLFKHLNKTFENCLNQQCEPVALIAELNKPTQLNQIQYYKQAYPVQKSQRTLLENELENGFASINIQYDIQPVQKTTQYQACPVCGLIGKELSDFEVHVNGHFSL